MKNTSLKAEISRIAATHPNRTALKTSAGVLAYRDLAQTRWGGAKSNVVVFCADLANALRAIIALDGVAGALCAINTTLSQDEISVLLEQYNFDCVISDLGDEALASFKAAGLTCFDMSALDSSTESSLAEPIDTIWLIPTSGTTSTPKLVEHFIQTLAHSAFQRAKIVDEPEIWALFYDVTRFAGYQVLFHVLLSGHTLVFPGLTGPMDARVDFCAEARVTHVSATPTLWRKILMCPASTNLSLQQITLGGEAADQPVLSSLSARYPMARVTHVFASTEAGVGLSVSDGKAGFPLSYVGKHFNGVEIALKDERLYVRSAGTAQGYAGDRKLLDAQGWVDTGDLVRIDGDRFYIIGRESGVINVGGDKVVPEQVRHVLLGCDLVADALVYGKKNPFTGALVVANVKLAADMDQAEAKAEIEAYLKEHLSQTQRPRVLRFVTDIHSNLAGKVVPQT